MPKSFALLTALLALSFALPGGGAAHCTTWSTSNPELTTPSLGGSVYYWDNDWIDATWIYQEINGIEGLQRGDSIVDDTCHGMIEADLIIF